MTHTTTRKEMAKAYTLISREWRKARGSIIIDENSNGIIKVWDAEEEESAPLAIYTVEDGTLYEWTVNSRTYGIACLRQWARMNARKVKWHHC